MANNDNVVKIGTALKWRGSFDLKKKYYNENIVSACGCVFRCKILQAQNLSPIEFEEETGHIIYVNPDVWDVIVDNAFYFNFAVDTKILTEETIIYVTQLKEDINLIKKDDEKQWKKIHKLRKFLSKAYDKFLGLEIQHNSEIESVNAELKNITEKQFTQEEILRQHAALLQRLMGNFGTSVVSMGIWENVLVWENGDLWWNFLSNQNTSCGCSEHNQTVDKKIELLETELSEVKELLKKLVSKDITVEEYDAIAKQIKLGGPIYFVDYKSETQTGEFSAPVSDITHDSDGNILRLS